MACMNSLQCFEVDLPSHASLPLASNLQAGLVRVHDQEGGRRQLKVVLPDQLLD